MRSIVEDPERTLHMNNTAPPSTYLSGPEDAEAAYEFCEEMRWGDGLPIIPPTDERVERMLAFCDRPRDEPILQIPPSYGAATPRRIAANAVMAGCKPQHFPIVLLALEAMAEQPYNLYGIQTTTHPCAPLIIVSGPVADEIGLNGGYSALGSGSRSNATIGRAVRLSLTNIGEARPGAGDMATYGSPTKFTYCLTENETKSPWAPVRMDENYAEEETMVMVVAAEGPHNVNDHESVSAEGVLKTLAGTIATPGCNNAHHDSRPVVLLCPEHAATIASGGYSKDAVKAFLFEHARIPLSMFSFENVERRLRVKFPDRYGRASLDTRVPMARRPEDYIVLVAGGAGKHSAYIPTFGATLPVSRVLRTSAGETVTTINQLRAAA